LIGKYNIYFTLGWKRNGLFVYSAGRAIVLRNAPTQITMWVAQRAVNTPAEGRLVVIFLLLGHFLKLFSYQLSRQIV